MTFKGLSREELTEYLTDGIPLPKSAMTDENTIDLLFEELETQRDEQMAGRLGV